MVGLAEDVGEVRMRPTYGAELLAECLTGSGAMEVVKMQPPDGMVVRDILGNVYGVQIHEQATEKELREARSLEA